MCVLPILLCHMYRYLPTCSKVMLHHSYFVNQMLRNNTIQTPFLTNLREWDNKNHHNVRRRYSHKNFIPMYDMRYATYYTRNVPYCYIQYILYHYVYVFNLNPCIRNACNTHLSKVNYYIIFYFFCCYYVVPTCIK